MNKMVEKIITNFILNQPYFAVIAMSTPIEENSSIEKLATNGEKILFNSKFLDSIDTFDKKVGVFAHEFLHIALLHTFRRGKRDRELWNIAADYEVNLLLLESGFVLPEGALVDYRFKEKTAEEIYDILSRHNRQQSNQNKQNVQNSKQNNNAQGNQNNHGNQQNQSGSQNNQNGKKQSDKNDKASQPNSGSDDQNKPTYFDLDNNEIKEEQWDFGQIQEVNLSASQKKEKELKIKNLNNNAIKAAVKKAGTMPASIKRTVEELLKAKINYREVMQRFFDERVLSEYDWKRPNKRYLRYELYLPKRGKNKLGNGVVFVDTSGSIDSEMMRTEISEIFGLLSYFDIEIDVVCVDAAVQSVTHLTHDSNLDELVIKGGGGTDYRPAFKWLKDNEDAKWVIYYTDGYCNSFPEDEPDIPVLWVLVYPNRFFKPPFGEVVSIN